MKRLNRVVLIAATTTIAALIQACGEPSERQLISSAKASLGQHDLRTATIQLKGALGANPSSAEARYLLGTALLEAGDLTAAELELRKAKALAHPPEQWAPALAKTLLLRGQAPQVLKEFMALELPNIAAQSDLNASVAAAQAVQGHRDLAISLIERNLRALPTHTPTLMLKARLLARPGTLQESISLVNSVLERSPKDVEAWQLMGDLRIQGERDIAKAVLAYGKVLAIRPADVTAHSALIYAHLAAKDLKAAQQQFELMAKALPGHPQTTFQAARLAFLNDNLARAHDLIQTLLSAAPNSIPLLEFAGAVSLALNSPLKAEAYLNKALAQSQDLPPVRRLLAEAYLQGGKPAKAIEVLKPNVERDSPDLTSLSQMAIAHMQNGDFKKGEAYFQQAAKLSPEDPQYRTALALALLAKGQTEPAFTELRSIAASATDSMPDLALISALVRRQKFDQALQAIERLERKQPDKPVAANLQGRLHLVRRDLPAARKSFERALQINSSFLPALSSLAAIEIAEGKPELAEARYRTILTADPKNSQVYVALARLQGRNGGNKDQVTQTLKQAVQANAYDPAPRLLLVHHFIDLRDMKSAAAAAQAGVTAMPSSAPMLDALGSIQLLTGEVNQAIATFGKVAALQPASSKAQLRLADAHLQAKDFNSAERSFKRALEIDPDELNAQRGIISLAVRAKQPDRALDVARNIQRQRPAEGVGYLIEGDIQTTFKHTDAALAAYRNGLDRPNPGAIAERLYEVLYASKGKSEAARFADEWIKRKPGNLAFQMFLGNSAIGLDDLPSAEKYFSKIVAINPNNAMAMNNLAWVTAKMGRPGAIAQAEKAVALASENPAILDTLAFALAANGQLPKAIESAKLALVLAPDEPIYRLNLARYYLKSGKIELAKTELDRLSALGPKFARQSEVAELRKGIQ